MKRTSHIYKLNPVLEGGVLRVGGRLSMASMPKEAKHPVILAKDQHISDIILRQVRKEVGHSESPHDGKAMLEVLDYWHQCGNKKDLGKVRCMSSGTRSPREPTNGRFTT